MFQRKTQWASQARCTRRRTAAGDPKRKNDIEMDVYRNFVELSEAEREDIDFCISVVKREGSNIVIVVPHGGAIEPGTSEVAKEVANNDLSLAIFEGIKPKGNNCLHITSTNFDEPRCVELVQASDTVVAIHGERSDELSVFLGGSDDELCLQLKAVLKRYGFTVKTHGNPDLHGLAAENICNRGRHGVGVQLELSSGLRQTFFQSLTDKGRKKPTDELVRFAAAVREALHTAGRL
ncbi:MAG TPA: replication protein [Desulfobacteraceae bacterium]|nr:replication protein [Desulfobacteraceae bacterium]